MEFGSGALAPASYLVRLKPHIRGVYYDYSIQEMYFFFFILTFLSALWTLSTTL